MLQARKLDERMWVLHRQGKVAFHISGMGQEACQVGAAFAMERGKDWLHPYYRDMAFVMALGMTPRHLMLALFGKAEDPSSGGRQMPAHFGYAPSRIVSGSSPVATQCPQAAGIAFAAKLRGLDEVVFVCLGEGSTSQGDFHEALNWAGIHNLPLITLVQNNQYAISVPLEKADARAERGGPRRRVWNARRDVRRERHFRELQRGARGRAARPARARGRRLLEAKTYRPTPHSSDDDDRSYRSRDEVEMWKKRDPILRMERRRCVSAASWTTREAERILNRVMAKVDDATEYAQRAPYPRGEDAMHPVFGGLPHAG